MYQLPLTQAISFYDAFSLNFLWVWKRTCWNRNRLNWNGLNKKNVAVILYARKNWYILWQLWRMHQMKSISQFAPVLIHVMLVIIRRYRFCHVDDYNHVHYTVHHSFSKTMHKYCPATFTFYCARLSVNVINLLVFYHYVFCFGVK